ncbi:MAG: ubiquitin-like small modifier protein 1 [Dehalococcoidia bacterium]|nr:ubiquitin-like small modifier protein 1 [Dehalococcoidia bacterium]
MTAEVQIPSLLRKATGGEKQVKVEGETVKEVLDDLTGKYPELKERILTAEGNIQPFVVLYVNNEDIRFLQDLGTPVKSGDVISILPAVAGGR